MKQSIAVAIVASCMSLVVSTEITPVAKVIQMINGMLNKGKTDKVAEQKQYAAYKQWCDDTATDKGRQIEEANENIEMFKATIEQSSSEAKRLGVEISQHDADLATWAGDKKAATKVRQIEKADYDALHQDYSESLNALKRAIAVLSQQAKDRPQAALAQVSALNELALIPEEAKKELELFLVQEDNSLDQPQAAGYEFRSHGIIGLLNELTDKFTAERTALEQKEMNAKNAYDLLIQDLDAQTGQATQDRDDKTSSKAKELQTVADAKGDLTDTTNVRDADQKFLADTNADCSAKAGNFKARQTLRADEIEALSKAVEILSSGQVKGHAETHLPASLVQKSRALAQFMSATVSPAQQHVADFLERQGSHLNSHVLSALAVRVAQDPFEKVKKMIQDLIVRLKEEASQEATHKGWCDTELASNKKTRKEKTEAIEMLDAEIATLEASIKQLSEQIAALQTSVAKLDSDVAEKTKIRTDDKKTNMQTMADAKEAQAAVAQARDVLAEFYAKAGEATSLAQQPPIFDEAYKGMQSESGGVMGMLEVIQSDFARLEADTQASENADQSQYDKFISDSKLDKAAKEKEVEHRTAKKQDDNQALQLAQEDKAGTSEELKVAEEYFEKLKPSCIATPVSYETRVAHRQEEIDSLKEALQFLNDKGN